jgi:predicted amidohydrolase
MSKAAVSVALVQLCATTDVEANLATSERLVREAAGAGARVVLLPEAFAFIGPDRLKREIVEPIEVDATGETPILERCRRLARELDVELILGGHHEKGDPPLEGEAPKSYNTCVHIGADGALLATYRKIHLFDVQLADGTELRESARTLAGNGAVVTETAFGSLGLTICYDIRCLYRHHRRRPLACAASSPGDRDAVLRARPCPARSAQRETPVLRAFGRDRSLGGDRCRARGR